MMGAIRLAGAVPRSVTLRPPAFALDTEAAAALREAAASPRARMVVLNTPHNPTGKVATGEELDVVAEVCREHGLVAVADEVYENSVFPSTSAEGGGRHLRLADREGMRDRTITISSGGKLFSLTGWRVAWAVGAAALLAPLAQAHTHLTYSAPSPLQAGVAAALDAEDGLEATAPLFAGNFELLAAALRAMESPAVGRVCEAAGGYFLVAETDGRSDVEYARALAEEKGVVCTPMSVFYSTPFPDDAPCTLVRFTVCKSRAHVEAACAALRRV